MVHVVDPMNVLVIADLKEEIARKVCTSSVDFAKGEIILFVKMLPRRTNVENRL